MLLAAVAGMALISHALADQKNIPISNTLLVNTPTPADTSAAQASVVSSPPATDNLQSARNSDHYELRLPRFITRLFDSKPEHSEDSPGLPLGLSYSSEAKGLLLPLDENKNWGIGLGMDLSNRSVTDAPVDGRVIEYRPVPGAVLQRRF